MQRNCSTWDCGGTGQAVSPSVAGLGPACQVEHYTYPGTRLFCLCMLSVIYSCCQTGLLGFCVSFSASLLSKVSWPVLPAASNRMDSLWRVLIAVSIFQGGCHGCVRHMHTHAHSACFAFTLYTAAATISLALPCLSEGPCYDRLDSVWRWGCLFAYLPAYPVCLVPSWAHI